ncbi:MAG: triose-phosphate isomerase [Parachlamydiaceae bacterium]
MSKAPIIILDIKANLTLDDVIVFLNNVTENGDKVLKNLYVALPHSLLKEASQRFSSSGILFGSSFLHNTNPNSFTGPIATSLVKEIGATFTLIGSMKERSKVPNREIADKLEACQKSDLMPIFCIGETLEERKEDKTIEILKTQLHELSSLQPKPLMIVYQIPFASFKDYLPSESELQDAYRACKEASSDLSPSWQESISWIVELPIDLAGFSKGTNNVPFDGFYFRKAGVFPHAVHSEALKLFHLHAE